MISQVSSLSWSAASAASRKTERSRYRASGSAAPGMRSNVSAAAQTSGSRHTRRPFDVPSGRLANTTSSRPASSCSINSALTAICTSSFTPEWSAAKRPRAEGSEPPATSSTTPRRTVPDTRGAGQARRRQTQTGGFFELQQATRVAEQHFPVIRQRNAACRAPEQGTLGLELEPLDLLAYRRLRQVEPFGCSMETAAIGHGNEGAQQLEIQHRIDPQLRSVILENIDFIINDVSYFSLQRTVASEGGKTCFKPRGHS